MDWLDRMNGAISYVEENLAGEIDFETVAKIACCSVYHFQRMFSFIVGVPLSEYIRRRRLTLAAFELQNSDIKVIDLALKYDYDSPISFSRAFQNLHGVAPSLARDKGTQLKAYPRLSFQITIKGDVGMDYRIEQTRASKIFGKSIEIKYHDTQMYEDAKNFVMSCIKDGTAQEIRDVLGLGDFKALLEGTYNDDSAKLYGLTAHYGWNDSGLRFMAGMDHPDFKVPDHFEVLEIPEATWAVFSITGTKIDELDSVNRVWKRVCEWFQVSGYEHMPGVPELERNFRIKDGYLTEAWIPVVKK
ncbi:MAG: AraC family transcriptional regulator [Bacillota bacterium]